MPWRTESDCKILSPTTSEKDLTYKYELYLDYGVWDYWVVSPSEKTLLIYTLDGSRKYQPSRLYIRGDVVTSSVLEGFSMDLSEVFEPYDWVAHDEAEKYYHLI